ncbi:MAG: signal peptidase II [Eubacterium sp.]|nr:signal peptidase II [Eubacterium sp.]MDD7208610.1 signal peptidase II [Lachnospiraceae bacterium]MDY5497391.1 signal peptidase II [Anaerobutyricum sp.]
MIYSGIIFTIILSEMLIKKEVKKYVSEKPEVQVKTKKPVQIELLENEGGAGGFLNGHPGFLKGFCAICLTVCFVLLGRESQKGSVTMPGIGLSLIFGGGLCNFTDRLKKGSVTDYIRFPKLLGKRLGKLVFNLSDFCIFTGVIFSLFQKK